MISFIKQHNFRCKYKNIVMALKIALKIRTGIILLEELFINN